MSTIIAFERAHVECRGLISTTEGWTCASRRKASFSPPSTSKRVTSATTRCGSSAKPTQRVKMAPISLLWGLCMYCNGTWPLSASCFGTCAVVIHTVSRVLSCGWCFASGAYSVEGFARAIIGPQVAEK